MTKVDFYPIDIDYIIAGNKRAVARIFGRTTSGERICVFDKAVEPYFWIIPKRGVEIEEFRKKIEEIRIKESDRVCFVVKTEVADKLYLNKEVKAIKVIVNHPKDIGIIKDRLKLMHETEAKKEVDIPYTRRYLIERGITPLVLCSAEGEEIESSLEVDKVIEARELKQESGESFNKQRILAIDIEACYPANEEINPIIMIAFCGEDGFKKVVTYKKFETDNKNIKFVNDEAELIQEFKDTVREYKPDYLTGYFSDGFDFPYLRARADKYNMKLDLGLDRSSIKFSKRGQSSSCKIRGIIHIDIFKFIKNIMSGSLKGESYDLNSIASELLGEKKLDVDIYGLAKALEKNENLEKYCEYNLKDSELALNLLLKLIENINELVKLVGQPVFDVTRMSYGQLVEWHLIKRAKEFNEIVPNRPRRDVISKRRAKSYKGAFVFEPTAGLYERICVFDYRGLYPSVIVSKNIDPGMLSKYKYDSFETPEIETDGKKIRYLFSYKKEGFIPLVIKDLITRRIRIKEIIKNEKEKGEVDRALKARDYALKTLANAAYGYFAFFGARYYSLECAASITAFSREYIQKTIKAANDAGFKVVYSDSVDGNTKIIIKRDGEVYEEKIESIFDRSDKENCGKEYNFKDGVEVLTLDERGNSVFKPIEYVMRHRCNKKMFRIHFTNNWYIDVTEDHSLMGYQSSKFNSAKINKNNILKRIIEVKPDDIKKKVNTIITLKKIPNAHEHTRNYPKEVYEFLGYFIGDGSFVRNRFYKQYNKDYYLRLSLGSDRKELFSKLILSLINLGYIKSYWFSKTRKGDITINGLKLVKLVSNNFSDGGGKKIIPDWLFGEKEKNIASFLRGLFSADGCVIIRSDAPIIKYTSIKEDYIKAVRKLLYRVGVSHSVFKENSVNRYKTRFKIYSSGSYSRNIIIKDRDSFIKRIGFIIERKNKLADIKTKSLQKKFIRPFEFDLQSVKKIELIKTPKYVYDIEVEDNHRFFANYVLVHNTDSVAIILENKTEKDALNFLEEVNRGLPSLMELELENFYERGIFVSKKSEEKGAKKKYAFVDKEGNMKVVGFETIRRNWSTIGREVQKKVLEIVLKENDKEKALKYAKDIIREVREKKIEINKMVIKTQLRKEIEDYDAVGPHVGVAQRMRRQGIVINPGMMISFVVTEGKGRIRDRARLLEEVEGNEYDPDYYINNQIVPSIERIFEVLGYKKEDLLESHEQSKLGDFK